MAQMSPWEYALENAKLWQSRGFAVFPIDAIDRTPLTRNGFHDATKDPQRLEELFTIASRKQIVRLPAAGLVPASGNAIVLDIDVKNDAPGIESYERMGSPAGWRVMTPSGGWHLYFHYNESRGNESPWNGIDVRSANGYVVAPGSYAPFAAWEPYAEWSDEVLPELPDSIINALKSVERKPLGGNEADKSNCFTDGTPCDLMQSKIDIVSGVLKKGANRHDTAARGIFTILRLGELEHPGSISAIAQIHDVFFDVVGKSPTHPHLNEEWSRMLQGAVKRIEKDPSPSHSKGCACKIDALGINARDLSRRGLEDKIFDYSEQLKTIRQAARSAFVSPQAVLGSALAVVLSETPPFVMLPPIVGARASLNLAVALVGQSGLGKSSSVSIALDVLGITRVYAERINTPTGEGLLSAFLEPGEKDPDQDKRIAAPLVLREFPNVLMVVDEIEQWGAVSNRAGATGSSVLRSMLTGDEVGTTNAANDRKRRLPRGSYRLAGIIGVQPEHADILLKEQAAGTPQRFIWVMADDPDREKITETISFPNPIGWRYLNGIETNKDIQIPDTIRDEVIKERLARLSGRGIELDAHHTLTKLKVASACALLHSRNAVTQGDWEWAELVMILSIQAREYCQAVLKISSVKKNIERGKADGKREAAKQEAMEENAIEVVARRIQDIIANHHAKHEGNGCTKSCFTIGVAKRFRGDKTIISASLDHLLKNEKIINRGRNFLLN